MYDIMPRGIVAYCLYCAFSLSILGDEEKRSFLATPAGESYVDLFRLIRLQHVVRDVDSCQSLENDGIIPSGR